MQSFLVLLLVFLATQYVAWRNMLRGRMILGFVQFSLSFALADLLLILHFIASDDGVRWTWTLAAFWAVGLLSIGEYVFHALRARSKKFQESQARRYSESIDAFMQGRDGEAVTGFRRCCWNDPWDSTSALMLGTVLGSTKPKRAQRWLRRARDRASDKRLRDEIEEELRCLTKPRRKVQAPRTIQVVEPDPKPEAPATKHAGKKGGAKKKAAG